MKVQAQHMPSYWGYPHVCVLNHLHWCYLHLFWSSLGLLLGDKAPLGFVHVCESECKPKKFISLAIKHIQGVQQNTFHFCFSNFSASYGSRNSILDIFQQPFLCRFWKYPIFYYLVKSGPRYCKNTAGCSFLKLTFFIDYLNQVFEHSWMCISVHEHWWALISTQKPSGALMIMVNWCHEFS